ncbi:SRPBCC family protein [Mucilaginibacter terrae]|uniref:SRPBCC family protein n=1 Tax=Mucilaginibacter terrae TaxID=1955052 RepID=UPI00362D8844
MIITILYFIAGIIVLVLIVALFSRKAYSLQREIIIHKPAEEVYEYVKYLRNQDNYIKWAMADPDMRKTYTGTDAAVGFISAWDSDKKGVGKGEQEILKLTNGTRVDYEIRFIKPFAGIAQAHIFTENIELNTTMVTWGFASQMPYPMNIMLLFMNMEAMLGKDLETGLSNLKSLLER